MKFQIIKGSSSVILTVFIQDSSATTGAGLGSLDQTSSITGGYVKRNGTGVALTVDQNVATEGTYEEPSTAAQVRIGTPANMVSGTYELHFHDDLFTTADWVTITLSGASNMAPLTLEVQLTSVDLNDAVRGGMSSLPNAAADANNGIVTGDGSVTFTAGVGNRPAVDAEAISGDTTAANNLELQYDTTGLLGDTFPLRQDQGASIAGGLAIHTAMASVAVILGSEQDLSNASTSDNAYWTGDDDGSGAEFIFLCTPADSTSLPGDLHFEGYYDEPTGATNGATLEIYNFQTASWDSIITFTTGTSDEMHDVSLLHGHSAPTGGTLETVAYSKGDVLIKFSQDTTEIGNEVLFIDAMHVGFIGSALTATEIVNEWETQSQADPTGFHVNVLEVNGTGQTANDNGSDINDILVDTGEIGTAGAGLSNIDLPDQTMNITGNLSGSVGSVSGSVGSLTGHTVQTGDSYALIGTAGAGLTNIDLPNQTMDIIGNITGNLSGSVGSVTGAVGSVSGHTNQTGDSFALIGTAGASLTDLGGMSTGMKAQILVEADKAIGTTTYAEPSSVPNATASMAAKVSWATALSINKGLQTDGLKTLRNAADGADIATSTVSSDGTTFTRGKWA